MWFYHKDADAIEILTCLETGAQVVRSRSEVLRRENEGDDGGRWKDRTAIPL